jgi:hypothetical protein
MSYVRSSLHPAYLSVLEFIIRAFFGERNFTVFIISLSWRERLDLKRTSVLSRFALQIQTFLKRTSGFERLYYPGLPFKSKRSLQESIRGQFLPSDKIYLSFQKYFELRNNNYVSSGISYSGKEQIFI